MRTVDEQLKDAKALYDFHSFSDEPVAADFILACGSHDLRVADYAAELYKNNLAPLLVCSGGLGKVTTGIWSEAEGTVFCKRCVELGVPKDKIIVEDKASNSGENFTLTKKLLSEIGIFPKTGIIVCKPYMAKRAWATGTKQWPEITWYVSSPKISFEDYPTGETPLNRMINLMAGDLQRLELYPGLGFQVEVAIPSEIFDAYNRLVEDGYNEFIIKK